MDKEKLHLLPELILNLVEKYNSSKHPNEKFSLETRLEVIRDYIDQNLKQGKEKPFFKR